jgi:hypothetical protein
MVIVSGHLLAPSGQRSAYLASCVPVVEQAFRGDGLGEDQYAVIVGADVRAFDVGAERALS